MTYINKTLIKEVQDCKDILWYLRGQVDLAEKDTISIPFNEEHIESLLELITYTQNTYETKRTKDIYENTEGE